MGTFCSICSEKEGKRSPRCVILFVVLCCVVSPAALPPSSVSGVVCSDADDKGFDAWFECAKALAFANVTAAEKEKVRAATPRPR